MMDVQQAERLAAEARQLVENLEAAFCEAASAKQWSLSGRIITIQRQARRRWARRLDKLAVAAYGPVGVN